VSGAAAGGTVDSSAHLAKDTGRAIAQSGNILTTGATVGIPYFAAIGAKQAGGVSIGFSPAASFREHFHKYRLPSSCFDFINFTGMHYAGRDLYLVQSSDAVITIGGRFGSMHEFTSALESHKPCGVLLGSGGTADEIPKLIQDLGAPHKSLVIFDDDPKRLVSRLIELLDEKYKDIHEQLKEHDEEWFLKIDASGYHNG
jgi:uncharacterized protein (TIGR00725 family)